MHIMYKTFFMETEYTNFIAPIMTVCLLCRREVLVIEYEAHLQIHERAEMLADILALSRR
jgi:hypothetical protein